MTVRAVIFGNGFARSVVLPVSRAVPDLEVVGLASPNRARLAETAGVFDIPVHDPDHRAVLERCKPDLVFIATPPFRHLDQSTDALQAGAHVICEKPTALDANESARMLELARSHPEQLALIDHELRFDPRRRMVESWLRDGKLGRIHHACYRVHSPGFWLPRGWSWWYDAERGGGALGAIGSHAVDALRRWFEPLEGAIESVRGDLRTIHPTVKDDSGVDQPVTADELCRSWLDFPSGMTATVEISLAEARRVHEVTIVGDRGAVRLVEQGPLEWAEPHQPFRAVDVEDDLPSNDAMEIPNTDWARNLVVSLRAVTDAIREGQNTVDGAATFDDGHRTQLVLDAIRRSSACGERISVGARQNGSDLPV